MDNLFEKLSAIDVSEHVESKNGLNYLSWAWAWITFKKYCPNATYKIRKFGFDQLPYVYDEKTGYMVYTEVTVDDITHEMWLPVMDGANKAMKDKPYAYKVKNYKHRWAKLAEDGKYYDKYGTEQPEFFVKNVEPADMFDVNKTIMRCLVKNLAMFGLGMSLYAGEDLPQETPDQIAERKLKELEDTETPSADDFKEAIAKATAAQKKKIAKLCEEKGSDIKKMLAYYKISSIEDFTKEQAKEAIEILEKK